MKHKNSLTRFEVALLKGTMHFLQIVIGFAIVVIVGAAIGLGILLV